MCVCVCLCVLVCVCVILSFEKRQTLFLSQTGPIACRKKNHIFLKTHIPQFLISQKPAIHQFADACYLDQHGFCMNMLRLTR